MRDRRNTSPSAAAAASTLSPSPIYDNEKNHTNGTSSPFLTLSLPAPVTEKSRTSSSAHPRKMAARVLMTMMGLLLLSRVVFGCWHPSMSSSIQSNQQANQAPLHEPIRAQDLPDEPSALIVAAPPHRAPKWTVSIPHHLEFPLSPAAYRQVCTRGTALRETLAPPGGRHHSGSKLWWRMHRPTRPIHDKTFLDVEDAEAIGALPTPVTPPAADVCESSLTFVLESEHASFGKSLLMLWLSYGLAQKEGRAFFVDDSRWDWGRYTSYFMPPPSPGCSRPAPHYIVPCPASARHLVISTATAPWALEDWLLHRGAQHVRNHWGVLPQPQIYRPLRTGFEALFHLNSEDAEYARSRVSELKADAAASQSPFIGMQIRRGDLHPFEYQYNQDYLPLERYAKAAQLLSHNQKLPPTTDITNTESNARFVLASDDPDIHSSPDLLQAASPYGVQRIHERILLATKSVLDQYSPVHSVHNPGSAYVKHVDENTGWEGGFYSALFFSLGGGEPHHRRSLDPSSSTSPGPSEQTLQLRELVGRAYLLDLEILSQADGVVCAVSSATCRALAVMMGADKIRAGRWVNVDDARRWSWDGAR